MFKDTKKNQMCIFLTFGAVFFSGSRCGGGAGVVRRWCGDGPARGGGAAEGWRCAAAPAAAHQHDDKCARRLPCASTGERFDASARKGLIFIGVEPIKKIQHYGKKHDRFYGHLQRQRGPGGFLHPQGEAVCKAARGGAQPAHEGAAGRAQGVWHRGASGGADARCVGDRPPRRGG